MTRLTQRLDQYLVERGYFPSREQAQQAVRAGWVKINGTVLDKPSTAIKEPVEVLIYQKAPFVSRGGEKLWGAIAHFQISVRDRICLDGGISTGGFTDCLLQQGAKLVYGVDVGYGQVAWQLRQHPRLILKERTNLRYLQPQTLYGEDYTREQMATLAVVDVSFISLTKILPTLWELLTAPKEVLLLVKPQFEAQRSQVGKNGIVKDPAVHQQAISQVLTTAVQCGWQELGRIPAPIKGRTGNQEYWLWLAMHKTLAESNAILGDWL
ncbi:MAG: TlyA family RNA methyltransferase [Pseudanabaenaceae cyanobacterium]